MLSFWHHGLLTDDGDGLLTDDGDGLLTDDGDRRIQSSVGVEQVEDVELRVGLVGVGVVGGALHPRPLPHHTVPADDAVQDAAVVLVMEQSPIIINDWLKIHHRKIKINL